MFEVIQFTHPGKEHKPDNPQKNHKSWNKGQHKRKFLCCNGYYKQNNKILKDKLAFWGEWEPPSKVKKLDNKDDKEMPQWLHFPYLPNKMPISDGYQLSYQNTDPFVFGKHFRYLVCKQFKPKLKKETFLSRLNIGSIILFGSTINQKDKSNAYFALDTIFVISDYIEYDPSDPNALNNYNIDNYKDIVYKMAFPKPLDFSLKLRLYIGATIENPIEGMYSFSPAKVYKNEPHGFKRLKLKNLPYITNNLNAAPKRTFLKDITEVKIIWEEIREKCKKEGLVEGIKFDMPHKESTLFSER